MGDVYRVRSEWTGVAGAPWVSTQFFETTTTGSAADAQAAATKVANFWSAFSIHIHGDGTLAIESTVDLLSEISGELVNSYSVTTAPTQPAGAGDKLPPVTQGLLRLETGVILDGRRIRGRIFIPAPLEADSTGGAPTAAYVTDLGTADDSLFAAPANPALAVWHRPVFDPVTGARTRDGQAVVANAGAPQTTWSFLRSRRD